MTSEPGGSSKGTAKTDGAGSILRRFPLSYPCSLTGIELWLKEFSLPGLYLVHHQRHRVIGARR